MVFAQNELSLLDFLQFVIGRGLSKKGTKFKYFFPLRFSFLLQLRTFIFVHLQGHAELPILLPFSPKSLICLFSTVLLSVLRERGIEEGGTFLFSFSFSGRTDFFSQFSY